jgi:hypothetical protein
MNADGTGEAELTDPPGLNLSAKWDVTREPCEDRREQLSCAEGKLAEVRSA